MLSRRPGLGLNLPLQFLVGRRRRTRGLILFPVPIGATESVYITILPFDGAAFGAVSKHLDETVLSRAHHDAPVDIHAETHPVVRALHPLYDPLALDVPHDNVAVLARRCYERLLSALVIVSGMFLAPVVAVSEHAKAPPD
ncbi:hypothetical protein CHGG_01873 [Chaetomium globosum CBS 148.51]|uniref:Uncharacterized protein n=1 Tax=Chaetomium globosum (strain ATCC 6205 / CBS 148.51 / DSM 1962 / NBRC 6347 / NRRL 1970) TaxID=306901 RepID=Q2HD31_CHAGB|nr:uncharacterized protein CHGG_01873 [Chaetomium globosum CBS 148.51]EAQ93638.1 hypothetical protein CHGG_01873 [Chaetomium globosum CBS 148.51]